MNRSVKLNRTSSDKEMVAVLKSIPSLRNILRDTNVILNKSGEHSGFMYLSRFKAEESDLPVEDEKTEKIEEDEEESFTEIKNSESGILLNSSTEKKRRYALSLATLAAKPSKRLTIVKEGAISILVELAVIHDRAIQVRCASAFASIAKEKSCRTRMLDEGALSVIALLAQSSSIREVKEDCCRAICNLACMEGCEYKMLKEGVPFVVTHVAAVIPDCFNLCLKILLNLSCVPDKYARIEELTEALMYFVNINTLSTTQEHLLVSAFCNLAALRNNQLRLVEDGCVRVVEKYYQSKDTNLRIMSCEILKNLTMDNKTRIKLLDMNVMTILLNMFHDPEHEIKLQCVRSFLYLSKDVNFRQKIVNGEAFKLIMQASMKKMTDVEMGRLTAKTLQVLCGDLDISYQLVKFGVGKALMLLMESGDHIIDHYCAESLCYLFKTRVILQKLITQGADVKMVKLANETATTHPLTAEWCSFALFELTLSSACVHDVMQDMILPCMIWLCELDNTTEIAKSFCAASFSFATHSKSIDCFGAIPLLVKMLRSESSQIIKKYCASALFNLADTDMNCHKMLDSEALLPVVELTQSEYMQTKVMCAGIISRLSLHRRYYDQFAAGSVLKVLLELSCVDHRLTQRRVVIALSNLSQNEELKTKLLELNPIPYIISLASERDEYLRRGCISIVCNMSYLPGSESAIVKAGILPTLMITSLITSDQIVSKVICVKALMNLMADSSLYQSMVKDGVIWGLSKLAQLDDPELLRLSSKALCCLSCEFARAMLASNVAVKTIMSLIARPDLDLKKSGARTLTNVLMHTTNADEDFHKYVVENMLSMAKTSDDELNELCVICLCLASQSESCRTSIVSSGMLQMIDASTIFADQTVSYAYITMFGNIANNPLMRSHVMDDLLIDRFDRICMSKDYNLDLAVAKALYCVSCSPDNILKLVDQKIIPFVRSLVDTYWENDAATELKSHLIAGLYNLTTVEEVQNKLVSEGVVELLCNLWHDAEQDFTLCCLAYTAICHLACGKTNSTRMVADGCTSILCFITEKRQNPATAAFKFPSLMYLRCSAAFRNLLMVASNHKAMEEAGCVESLIELSHLTNPDRYSTISTLSSNSGNALLKVADAQVIRKNCSAALKSMTYSKEIREKLANSDAIHIILSADGNQDGLNSSLGMGLLKELEAESWDNGARGRQKGGRAKPIPPDEMFTDLLRGASNVQLNVELKTEQLEKFYVQVQLDEPGMRSDQDAEDEAGVTPGGIIELGIENLSQLEDSEEPYTSITQGYHKQECEVNSETVALLRIDSYNENTFASYTADELAAAIGAATAEMNLTPTNGQLTPLSLPPHGNNNNNSNGGGNSGNRGHEVAEANEKSMYDRSLERDAPEPLSSPEKRKLKKKMTPHKQNSYSEAVNAVEDSEFKKSFLPNLFFSSSQAALEEMQEQKMQGQKMGRQNSMKSQKPELPRLNSTMRREKEKFKGSIRSYQKAQEKQEFQSVIDMIRSAKEEDNSGGLLMALDKWKSMSRY